MKVSTGCDGFDLATSVCKVCLATPDIIGPVNNGGIGTAYTNLAQSLSRRGYDVTILYLLGEYCERGSISQWQEYYNRQNITFTTLPQPDDLVVQAPYHPRLSYLAYLYLRDHSFDVIHFPEWSGFGFYTALAIDSVDLSGLDTVAYHTLRLHGLLYRKTSDAPDDPALLNWEIGNMATFVSIGEYDENIGVGTPMLKVFPSVTSSHLNILCAFGTALQNGRLKIYDVTGRTVKEFDLSGFEMTEPTSFIWNRIDDKGRRVAAGVYFVRVEADDYLKTEKAILLK